MVPAVWVDQPGVSRHEPSVIFLPPELRLVFSYLSFFFGWKFRRKMPAETSRRVAMMLMGPVPASSERRRIERTVPKKGVEKLKMVTRETGLCLRRTPQRAYATAERAER